jgi:hypothetical protein
LQFPEIKADKTEESSLKLALLALILALVIHPDIVVISEISANEGHHEQGYGMAREPRHFKLTNRHWQLAP